MAALNPTRWNSLCGRLGVEVEDSAFDDVQRRYSESWRAYHNVRHIADCLEQFDRCRDLATRSNELEFAIWMHDVIYDTHRADNEKQSAEFATTILDGSDCNSESVEMVSAIILATEH